MNLSEISDKVEYPMNLVILQSSENHNKAEEFLKNSSDNSNCKNYDDEKKKSE